MTDLKSRFERLNRLSQEGLTVEDAVEAIESNRHLGRYEAVHATVARALGCHVQITDHGDHAKASYSGQALSDEQFGMITMGPEVYMEVKGFAFTKKSVMDNREKLTEFPKEVKRHVRSELQRFFLCPHVCTAIDLLTEKTGNDIHRVNRYQAMWLTR